MITSHKIFQRGVTVAHRGPICPINPPPSPGKETDRNLKKRDRKIKRNRTSVMGGGSTIKRSGSMLISYRTWSSNGSSNNRYNSKSNSFRGKRGSRIQRMSTLSLPRSRTPPILLYSARYPISGSVRTNPTTTRYQRTRFNSSRSSTLPGSCPRSISNNSPGGSPTRGDPTPPNSGRRSCTTRTKEAPTITTKIPRCPTPRMGVGPILKARRAPSMAAG